MGASPYYYFVAYDSDIQKALDQLREREFKAGRYNPVMAMPDFPIDENSAAPGAQHDSIDDALEDAEEDGTRSILDLDHVSSEPYDGESDDYGSASPLSDDMLEEFFETTKPTTSQVEQFVGDVLEDVERGMGIYIVTYKDGTPDQIFFGGYSYD